MEYQKPMILIDHQEYTDLKAMVEAQHTDYVNLVKESSAEINDYRKVLANFLMVLRNYNAVHLMEHIVDANEKMDLKLVVDDKVKAYEPVTWRYLSILKLNQEPKNI